MIAELVMAVAIHTAQAATVKNPRTVEFTCPDHDRDDQHELDIVRTSDGAVIQTLQLGDPAVDGDGLVRASINVQPVSFGEYVVRVRVLAQGVSSDNSADSNVWQRAPGSPGGVVAK
jgi:hypothetical protein